MKKTHIFKLLLLVLITLGSCSDDGINGKDGNKGKDGKNAKSGKIVLFGDVTNEEAKRIIEEAGESAYEITITNTKNLTEVVFPHTKETLNVEIGDNQRLKKISFPELTDSYGYLSFGDNDLLTKIEIPELKNTKHIYFSNNKGLETINFTNIDNISGRLQIIKCESLTDVTFKFNNNIDINRIYIEGNTKLKDLTLSFSGNVEDFYIQNNESLKTINFNESKDLTINNISLYENNKLENILFPNLEKGDIEIKSSSLSKLDFPKLKKGNIKVDGQNTSIKYLNIPLLEEGSILVSETNITKLNLSKFKKGDVNITKNYKLSDLNLTNLEEGNEITIESNMVLYNLNLPKLHTSKTLVLDGFISIDITALKDIDYFSFQGTYPGANDYVLNHLVNINPVLENKQIITSEISSKSQKHVETLRSNNNSVEIY